MTTTYDPFHPKYLDKDDLREEMDRVFDLCHGCRLCFKFCPSFPTLFEAIDRHDEQDSALMTDAERFEVVDECFNCKLCGELNCPYTPGKHEWALDFPRLMLRSKQVQHAEGAKSARTKLTDAALARTDLSGTMGSALAPLVNKAIATPGSGTRKLMEKATGIAQERVLPPYAKQRFSTWFKKRTANLRRAKQASVVLFPTCLVEYQDTRVGQDLVQVYERNGIACSLPPGQRCCGAPALHQGNIEQFVKDGRKNVTVLAQAIREGAARGEDVAVVVPQPTCGFVLKQDYVTYLGDDDAKLVAEHTYDASEYLWTRIHKGEGTELDTDFGGEVPEAVTYHAPCHLRAQNVGLKSRDVMKLTGTKVTVVAECSGIDGTWGLRAENLDDARKVARKMAAAITKADNDVVAGDCSLANGGIVLETGAQPVHPLSVLARAYGIPPET